MIDIPAPPAPPARPHPRDPRFDTEMRLFPVSRWCIYGSWSPDGSTLSRGYGNKNYGFTRIVYQDLGARGRHYF